MAGFDIYVSSVLLRISVDLSTNLSINMIIRSTYQFFRIVSHDCVSDKPICLCTIRLKNKIRMPGIGIRNLVIRGIDYPVNFIDQFIKSSTNIKTSIKRYARENENTTDRFEELRNLMIGLIRDTYVCNLLLGYTGIQRLTTDDIRYDDIDAKLMRYVDDFYNDDEFSESSVFYLWSISQDRRYQ